LNNTPADRDRSKVQAAMKQVEIILDGINERIREREGQERLAVISKDLWIGQGYVTRAGGRALIISLLNTLT
jgi:actin cytoskeleton-regulatory complex protein PAN1